MGPFTQRVAMGGKPEDKVKGLILLSHGTGGTEVGHTSLAEGLARQGYLVARPADNPAPTTGSAAARQLADARVRAVLAMAPVGAVLSAESFADVKVPTAIYSADKDRFLVPRFHAEWVAKNLPAAQFHHVPNALHFAFMDTPTMPIATEDGDIATDLPGFERQEFLRRLQREIPAFFDMAFQ